MEPPCFPSTTVSVTPLDRLAATISVQSTIETCYAVATDLQAYPEWVESVDSVEVLDVDDQGRPLRARFAVSGFGSNAEYVLGYDHRDAPFGLSWRMHEGNITTAIEGGYRFHDMTEQPDRPVTDVDYDLAVALSVSLPDFVRRRAEDKLLATALESFKRRVESFGNDETIGRA
jgi:uncharacterized membrane protein